MRKLRLTEALAKVARLPKSSKPHDLTLGRQAVGWDPSRLAPCLDACGALRPPPGAKVAEDGAHLLPPTLAQARRHPQECRCIPVAGARLPAALFARGALVAKRCSRR